MSHLPRRSVALVLASFSVGLGVYTGCVGDTPVAPTDAGTGTDASAVDTGTSNDGGVVVDAGSDVVPASDGASDAATKPCDLAKPFGVPLPVSEVNTSATEEGAWPSPNGLELYVARREQNNDLRLYRYTRPDLQSVWVLDGLKPELSIGTASDGGSPMASAGLGFTNDGLTVYLSVFEGLSTSTWGTQASTRSTLQTAWTKPVAVVGLDTSASDQAVWLNSAGTRIYFQSTRGGGNFRIYSATKSVNGFNAPTPVGAIMSGEDRFPVLTADELTIYFGSYTNPPDGGVAQMYVYSATRATTSGAFANPQYESINAAGYYNAPVAMSANGCDLYLTATRQGSGGYDIYVARRPK